MKISVMGSAFGPPTLGHFDVMTQVDKESDVILLVPAFRHGFGKEMAPFESRLAMSKLLCEDVGNQVTSRLIVEDIERQIAQGNDKPVYTYDLMLKLEEKYPGAELQFVMGPDNWKQIDKFYRGTEIAERWGVAVAEERSSTRSSTVRSMFVDSAPKSDICEHITPSVYNYIVKNRIY